MPLKTTLFIMIEVSPVRATIDEDRFRNTVLMYRATLAPSAKLAEHPLKYLPTEALEEQETKFDESGRQTKTEDIADATRHYAFDASWVIWVNTEMFITFVLV